MYSRGGQDPAPIHTIPGVELLDEVRPVLDEAADFLDGAFVDPESAPAVPRNFMYYGRIVESGAMRWPRNVQDLFTRFVIASAALALEEGGSDNPDFVGDMLRTHLEKEAEDPELSFLEPKILETADMTRRMRELSTSVTGSLGEAVTDDDQRFGLLRLLADRLPSPGSTSEHWEARTLQILDTFVMLGNPQSSLRSGVDEALAAGRFDGFLGEEVLLDASAEEGSFNGRERQETRKLIELGMHLSGESGLQAAIAKLVADGSRELWPDAPGKLLDSRRSLYARDLEINYGEWQDILSTYRCLPPESSGEDLPGLADHLLLEISKLRSTDSSLPMRQRIGAQATLDKVTKRRRRRAQEAAANEEVESQDQSQPETEQQPERELVYVRPDGTEAPAGSREYERIFKDFLAKYSSPVDLAEDLERIREYMKHMDWSAGTPRGIYTLGGGQTLKRGDREFHKVYQIKPIEVVGLPLSSRLGKKVRMVFVMENGTVGILGIAQRGKASALHRQLGVRGRTHSKD